MLEKTSDTVLALLTKSRNVFGSIDFGTPNNNSKGGGGKADRGIIRLSLAISMTFKAKTYKDKQFVKSKFLDLN